MISETIEDMINGREAYHRSRLRECYEELDLEQRATLEEQILGVVRCVQEGHTLIRASMAARDLQIYGTLDVVLYRIQWADMWNKATLVTIMGFFAWRPHADVVVRLATHDCGDQRVRDEALAVLWSKPWLSVSDVVRVRWGRYVTTALANYEAAKGGQPHPHDNWATGLKVWYTAFEAENAKPSSRLELLTHAEDQ